MWNLNHFLLTAALFIIIGKLLERDFNFLAERAGSRNPQREHIKRPNVCQERLASRGTRKSEFNKQNSDGRPNIPLRVICIFAIQMISQSSGQAGIEEQFFIFFDSALLSGSCSGSLNKNPEIEGGREKSF